MVNPRCIYMFAVKKEKGVVVQIGKVVVGGKNAGERYTNAQVPASRGEVQTAREAERL